jgi:PAS domain S-box-containing protein
MVLLLLAVGTISIVSNRDISDDITQLVESSVNEVKGAAEMSFALQSSPLSVQKLLAEKYRGFVDPTEFKAAENQARQANIAIDRAGLEFEKWLSSSSYNNNIIQSMQDTLLVLNADGTIRTVNTSALNLLGFEQQELLGASFFKVVEEVQNLFQIKGFSELIKEGFVQGVEITYLTKTGKQVPMLFSGSVMKHNNGEIQGIVCVAQDIGKRKRQKPR